MIEEQRQRLYEAVASNGPQHESGEHEGDIDDDALLLGWVVIAEWVDAKGEAWLSKLTGDASGKPLMAWREQGMLHNALYESWRGDEQ